MNQSTLPENPDREPLINAGLRAKRGRHREKW